jgi:flagellar hook-associated protein 1 FlgK
MGLSLALNTARSSLQASSSQMAVVSRNTAGATDPSYSRKIATLVSTSGAARVVVNRATDTALFYKMLGTTSDAANQQAVLESLDKLKYTVGDTSLNQSSAARLAALNAALQEYANKPDDFVLGNEVVAKAGDLATSLNEATKTVQKVRADADAAIAESVNRVRDLLNQFDVANKAVVRGSATGADISDSLDTRDNILAQLSEEMGITVSTRENNDMAIYTDSGVALYEKTPREIKFSSQLVYSPGTIGGAVFVDGVQVTGSGPMPLHSGRIVGLMEVRDKIAVTYQDQFDAVAKGLIEVFAEHDQTVPKDKDPMAGLFINSGGPDLPSDADTLGLAGFIRVNGKFDPARGGTIDYLRDGGANGVDYVYNSGSGAAFSDRLFALEEGLNADRDFASKLELETKGSLHDFATSSVSWIEGKRKDASTNVGYQMTLLGYASDALSNATGVNMDDETALMLQIEKSYSASAKLLSVIDEMLKTLLNAVR